MTDSSKPCPFCKEQIRKEAVKCRFCGEWLENPSQPKAEPSHKQEPRGMDSMKEWFQRHKPSVDKPNPTENATTVSATQNQKNDSEGKPLPKPVEKNEKSPEPSFFDIAPKKLYLIGTGFLLLGVIIIFWTVRGVDFTRGDSDKVTSALADLMLKPILGAAALAWLVHGFFGKRKGFRFLVFAITWTIVMAWCCISFRTAYNSSRAKSKAEGNQVSTLASNLLDYTQNQNGEALQKIEASPSTDKNSALMPVIEFGKKLAAAVGIRDGAMAGLQEQDIYDLTLLTNKLAMASEIKKRQKGEEIVGAFKAEVNMIIENARRRYDEITAPEKDKLSALHGFERSITNKASEREASYRLLAAQQKNEREYLQFMLDSFKDYQIKDDKILFSTDEALAGYNSHLKAIETTENEMAELRKTMLNGTKKSAEHLLK